jgi:hypothetical protein
MALRPRRARTRARRPGGEPGRTSRRQGASARDAVGLETAALGTRRAAVRLCADARALRRASLRVGTEALAIPTDALLIRTGASVSTDGGSSSSQGRTRRSMGSSIWSRGRPTQTSGRFARISGRLRNSQGRRAKAGTGFARSHANITHFSACPLDPGGSGADAKSGPRHARRPFARNSGRRRCASRRETSSERCHAKTEGRRASEGRVK